jgi:crotonobetainyl-CoA:carnitine CoA-transferase CaiB-like acyl-CoA transferase
MSFPLAGIKVLDFGRFQMGPLAGTWLADLGADVIKVEARTGDPVRGRHPSSFAIVTAHNRGKRSMAIDVTKPAGRDAILAMVPGLDVVIHNFRPDVMDRLGLGYETMREINPRIVFGASSTFGPEGKRRLDPGFDTIGQAMGGLAYATGMQGGPPIPAGAAIADSIGAYALVAGVCAALVERAQTGVGRRVDVSLYGTQIALQSWETNFSSISGQMPVRNGGYPFLSGYGIYPTGDGFIAIGGLNDTQWPVFCELVGRQEWVDKWPTAQDRLAARDTIRPAIDEILKCSPTTHWLEKLAAVGLIVSPVQNYHDILADEEARNAGYIVELEHPDAGTFWGAGSPWAFSGEGHTLARRPPDLGQHTEEVLHEFGIDWDGITQLANDGIIGPVT